MNTRAARTLTLGRVVALVVIAVLAAALAYIRIASGEDSVSVPDGAKAGDLTLEPCDFATEDGFLPADCGTLVVPENRADPGSRLIALPVTRIRARSGESAEPVFYLEGGPGITNMSFPQVGLFAKDRDVVLVGYRGVDGSVRLDCPEVDSALAHATDFFGPESYRAYGDAFRSCAGGLTDQGVDLAGYGLPQEVDDLEAARVALGYKRINLLSQSAGTRTALIYAWRFPDSIHRSVMIGVNPPGHFLWNPEIADEQIGRYADLCAEDPSCGRRTEDLAASMQQTSANMPDHWGLLPINESNVRLFTFFGLMESTPKAGSLSAPSMLDSWLAADEGDASGFWLQSFFGELMPIPFVWGQYAAGASLDAKTAREYFSADDLDRTNLGYVGSAFAWGGGRMAGGWPITPDADRYRKLRPSEVETLLISGELDFSTPPQAATKELLPFLPNGREVVLPGFGHTLTFLSEQQEAGAHLVNTYFDSGRVDTSRYRPQQVDFTPESSLPALAKDLARIMTGLVLTAVLSLVLLGYRVHRRGGLGRRASVALRALAPVLIGPGGWALGALIAYTALPGIPLGSPLLATISVGIPVGLGVYLAWVNPDAHDATRHAGFAAALAAALLGAWLGFSAMDGPLAVVTAIVGSGIGTNLSLLVLDITAEMSAHSRSATVMTTAPSPHTG